MFSEQSELNLKSLGDIVTQKDTSNTSIGKTTGDRSSDVSNPFQQALAMASQKTDQSNPSPSSNDGGKDAASSHNDAVQMKSSSESSIPAALTGNAAQNIKNSSSDKIIAPDVNPTPDNSNTINTDNSMNNPTGGVADAVAPPKSDKTGIDKTHSTISGDASSLPVLPVQNTLSIPMPLASTLTREVALSTVTPETNRAQSSAMAVISTKTLPVNDLLTPPHVLIAQSTSGKSANISGESAASTTTQMPIGTADVPQTTLPFHDIVSPVDTAPTAVGELKTHLTANAEMQTQTPNNDTRLMQDTVNPAKGDGGGSKDPILQIRVSGNLSSGTPLVLMENSNHHPDASHLILINDAQVSTSPSDRISGSGQDKQGGALSPVIGDMSSKAGQGMSEPMAIAQTPLKNLSAPHEDNSGNVSGASSDGSAANAAPAPTSSGSKTDMNQNGSGNEGNHGEQHNTNNSLSGTGMATNMIKSDQSTTGLSSPSSISLQDRIQVVDQTMRRLETMQITQGRQEITLHLKPDHLGDVQVTIVSDHHQLDAQIVTTTQHAFDALNDKRDQLGALLENRGYTLQGLDVSMQNFSQQRNFGSMNQPLNSGQMNSIIHSNGEGSNATNSVYQPNMTLSREYLDYSA